MYIAKSSLFVFLFLCVLGCDPNQSDDPIPFVPFDDIQIQLSLPQYSSLHSKVYYELNAGVRGIIVYRKDAASYLAYERNCSFRPNEACATVNVDVSGLFMKDPCCNSSFDFTNGHPTGGPAWSPLRQYKASLNGGILTITDEIIM
jgi:nitrite reductase/ring-hydroxylating ferredoxin subunit